MGNSGTVTQGYGLYITGFTGGAQTNTPYDIYAADTGAFNYIAGNVGIGVHSPNYPLSVKGTIGAGEVIVTNTSGWSDYVFDPGYQLVPLGDVAAYVKENHHLPDIPSADEVKKNGINVGEMQAKLLAKVEELTLHMIESEERSKRLELENLELKRETQQLRETVERVVGQVGMQ